MKVLVLFSILVLAVTCPAPPDIANGVTLFEDVLWGSEVRFQCDVGFRFENSLGTNSSAVCLETSEWSDDASDCAGASTSVCVA